MFYVPNNPYEHLHMSLDRPVVLQQVGCQDAVRKTKIHSVLENADRQSQAKLIAVIYVPEISILQKNSLIRPVQAVCQQCWPGAAASTYLEWLVEAQVLNGFLRMLHRWDRTIVRFQTHLGTNETDKI